jgi:DNA-binding beta-propeller fold protein YncE
MATGTGTFVSFRQYYSPDGTLIANSAGNAMLLIDAKTLEVIDHEPMGNLEENHDAIFTPDGKYVIATSRTKAVLPECKDPGKPGPDEYIMDGTLKLYDVAAKKFVGSGLSVCNACHQTEGIEEHAVLCGLDAIYH